MNKQLLANARSEILRLRRDNEVLAARNDVIEVFATALGMRRVAQGRAMSVDVAWQIEQELEQTATREKAQVNSNLAQEEK